MDPKEHPVVLFDGVCNLCNRSVQFILRKERSSKLLFGALQEAYAKEVLNEHQVPDHVDSILFLENGKLYKESTAALRIARYLKGGWPLLFYLFIWIPPFLRNGVYRFIAKRRYKWYGKKDQCMVPAPELRERFL